MTEKVITPRKKYGLSEKPIPCTEVWVRKMGFDDKSTKTKSYILINRKTGKRTHINVYDNPKWGPALGRNFDVSKATYDIGTDEQLQKKLKGSGREYSKCSIEDCPLAVKA